MESAPLRSLGPDLWCFERTLRRPPGFPARSCVVRLPDAELCLHAPLAIDDALAAALAQLGRVTQIIAPNRFHHLFLDACRRRYPQARLLAAPGLAAKLPALRPDATLAEAPPPSWQGRLVPLPIRGAPAADEHVFLHVPSHSLLVTDFVFNVRGSLPRLTRGLLALAGARERLAPSRLWNVLVRDRGALRTSARELLGLDFERLIPAHGEIVERGAREALARGLAQRRLFRDLAP